MSDIDRSHRVGGGQSRAILAIFVSYRTRAMIFARKKLLSGSKIRIIEDLTQIRVGVIRKAIEAYSLKSVWSSDGCILVKINNKKYRIQNENELSDLMETFPVNV